MFRCRFSRENKNLPEQNEIAKKPRIVADFKKPIIDFMAICPS